MHLTTFDFIGTSNMTADLQIISRLVLTKRGRPGAKRGNGTERSFAFFLSGMWWQSAESDKASLHTAMHRGYQRQFCNCTLPLSWVGCFFATPKPQTIKNKINSLLLFLMEITAQ